MRKHKLYPGGWFCVVVALFLVVSCATLQNFFATTHYKTFELTLNGQKVVVNLPNELPSMDEAIFNTASCYDTKLCVTSFCLSDKPGHGHVRFFDSAKNVVALMWCPTYMVKDCRYWLYLKSIPNEVDYEKLKKFLDLLRGIVPK